MELYPECAPFVHSWYAPLFTASTHHLLDIGQALAIDRLDNMLNAKSVHMLCYVRGPCSWVHFKVPQATP